MSKRFLVVLAALLLVVGALPLSAQEVTQTPGGEMGNTGMMSDVTRVQIGHFAPDAPPVVAYINGQAVLEALTYPALTGWLEFPGTSLNLMFVPEGAPEDQAVLGPVTVSNTLGGWLTLVVAGSATNGTLGLYAINQPTGSLAPNCARVLVFHGVEGGPTVDLQDAGGMSFGANLAFPGGMPGGMSGDMQATQEAGGTASGQAGMATMSTACAMTGMDGGMSGGAQATQDPSLMGTQEAGMGDGQTMGNMVMSGMRDYSQGQSLTCSLIATLNTGDAMMSGDAQATQDAMATAELGAAESPVGADAGSMLGTFNNCAYVIDVPAGAGTFGAYADGGLLADFGTTEFTANTYTFVALIGTADAPQVFTFTLQGTDVDTLLANEQQRMGGMGDTGSTGSDGQATQEAGGSG